MLVSVARPAPAAPTAPVHTTAPAKPDTLPVARMSIAQAQLAAARGKILLVDVRPAGQRALGHIQGDAYLPFERISASPVDMPPNRTLVFYCSCPAEEAALDAARILLARGSVKVAALVGGYDGWRAAGGAIQVDETWEEVFHVDRPPSGWGKVPVDTLRCRYARDDSAAGEGHASARVTCRPDTSARGFAGYVQKLDPQGLRGRMVTLSAMVRTADITQAAFLWIGAENAQGRFMRVSRPDQVHRSSARRSGERLRSVGSSRPTSPRCSSECRCQVRVVCGSTMYVSWRRLLTGFRASAQRSRIRTSRSRLRESWTEPVRPARGAPAR